MWRIAILLFFLGCMAARAQEVQVTLPDLDLQPGDTFSLPVTVTDTSGLDISSFRFMMSFDSNIIQISGLSTQNAMSSSWIVTPNFGIMPIVISAGDLNLTGNLVGPGTLLFLTGEVIGTGTSPLTLTLFEFNDGAVTSAVTNGQITVQAPQNQAPNGQITSPSGNITVPLGSSVTFAGSADDPDGNIPLTYLWQFDGAAADSNQMDPGPITFDQAGTYSVSFTATDALGLADPTPAGVTITVIDGSSLIQVDPISGLTTGEDGTTATFNVTLTAAPGATVVVPLRSSNQDEGRIDLSFISFTTSDWDTPREVVVHGVDDVLLDGDQSYTIELGIAQSLDPVFAGLDPADVALTNLDDESAPATVSLTVGEPAEAAPGDEILVPILVEDLTSHQVLGYQLELDYHTGGLTFLAVETAGTMSNGGTLEVNTQNGLSLAWFDLVPLVGDGTLLTLRFRLNDDAPLDSCLDVTLGSAIFNAGSPVAQTENGQVCTAPCLRGDVDGNGLVETFDAALVLAHVVDPVGNPGTLFCMDSDCNGEVQAYDASLISQFGIGLIDGFCRGALRSISSEPLHISLEDMRVVEDRAVAVPVHISPTSADQGVVSIQFTLDYDPALLSLTDLRISDIFGDSWFFAVNAQEPGRIRVGGYSSEPLTGEGLLLELTGYSLDALGACDLSWQEFRVNAGQPNALAQGARIEVEANQAPDLVSAFTLTEVDRTSGPIQVRVNDPNPGDQLLVGFGQPNHGNLISHDQGMHYQPDPGFTGLDGFPMEAADPGGLTTAGICRALVMPTSFFTDLAQWPMVDVRDLAGQLDQVAAGGSTVLTMPGSSNGNLILPLPTDAVLIEPIAARLGDVWFHEGRWIYVAKPTSRGNEQLTLVFLDSNENQRTLNVQIQIQP